MALRTLRLSLRECADRYLAGTDGLLGAAIAKLEGHDGAAEAPVRPRAGAVKELLDEIANLGLKPEKGRVKDLARIRRAADRASRLLDEA